MTFWVVCTIIGPDEVNGTRKKKKVRIRTNMMKKKEQRKTGNRSRKRRTGMWRKEPRRKMNIKKY